MNEHETDSGVRRISCGDVVRHKGAGVEGHVISDGSLDVLTVRQENGAIVCWPASQCERISKAA